MVFEAVRLGFRVVRVIIRACAVSQFGSQEAGICYEILPTILCVFLKK